MMLARAAADFYWMARYIERAENTARLLENQLTGLVDTSIEELAVGWRVLYRVLGQSVSVAPAPMGEAEAYLMADAYTLAATLMEDAHNPDSILQCWTRARDNAMQLRPWLPVRVWTCMNQGFLWLRECDYTASWAEGPSVLPAEVINRLRLLAGVIHARMPRDNAWYFMELGRYVERLQRQAALLDIWTGTVEEVPLSWTSLLRVCTAYEAYCRLYSMVVRPDQALEYLVRNPELPRSLRFATRRIQHALSEIDPTGARYPLAPPHRFVLRLAAEIESDSMVEANPLEGDALFSNFLKESLALHDLIVAEYVAYPINKGLPS